MLNKNEMIVDTVLLAGKIMIESGSDMTRVHDTMERIARSAGVVDPRIFETTTGIVMSIPTKKTAEVQPVLSRSIDLEKVARVNAISRAFANKELSLKETHENLQALTLAVPVFSFRSQLLAAIVVGCTLSIMYGGYWRDLGATALASGLGFTIYSKINRHFRFRFGSEFIAAFTIAVTALLCVRSGFGKSLDMIIIAGLMPLVPGVPITNAVRDLLAGHILSGIARGIEALLVAAALGTGVAVIFRYL